MIVGTEVSLLETQSVANLSALRLRTAGQVACKLVIKGQRTLPRDTAQRSTSSAKAASIRLRSAKRSRTSSSLAWACATEHPPPSSSLSSSATPFKENLSR